MTSTYVGRFAPSPTGPLHAGSLVAAVASYLDARAHRGRWLLRIEDLDPPREQPGATSAIITALRAHGLVADGPIIHQSQRHPAYAQALCRLQADGHVYRCRCSRRDILQALADRRPVDAGIDGREPVYPGTCRLAPPPPDIACAWRCHVGEQIIRWTDRSGSRTHVEALAEQPGDFVLQRRDGLWSYQLAVVVDDAMSGVTDVVRGDDLYSNTARQCLLQQWLGLSRPRYLHVPVVRNVAGEKLSKQTRAPAIAIAPSERLAVDQLNAAMNHLGLGSVDAAGPADFWPRAIGQWARYLERLPAWAR